VILLPKKKEEKDELTIDRSMDVKVEDVMVKQVVTIDGGATVK